MPLEYLDLTVGYSTARAGKFRLIFVNHHLTANLVIIYQS